MSFFFEIRRLEEFLVGMLRDLVLSGDFEEFWFEYFNFEDLVILNLFDWLYGFIDRLFLFL